MTRTTMSVQIDTDCHEIIPNAPLADRFTRNLELVGAPSFTDEEQTFAGRLQAPLREEFGTQFPLAMTVLSIPFAFFHYVGPTTPPKLVAIGRVSCSLLCSWLLSESPQWSTIFDVIAFVALLSLPLV